MEHGETASNTINKSKNVKIESLKENEKILVNEMDLKVDEIFGLRTRLAGFYRDKRSFLPVDSDGHRQKLDNVVESLDRGEDLKKIINFGELEGKNDFQSKLEKRKVLASFEVAVGVQRRLVSMGGDFANNDDESNKQLNEFYKYRYGELLNTKRNVNETEGQIEELTETLAGVKEDAVVGKIDQAEINQLNGEIKREIYELKNKLIDSTTTPEGYLYVYGKRLQEMKDSFDDGKIVETPYVVSQINKIKEWVTEGQPVFIHGELGSGKSELAKHVSRKYLSEAHLKRWEKQNQKPNDEKELAIWEAKKIQQKEPLFVVGYKGIEAEQIVGTRTIKRAEALSPEDQTKAIDNGWKKYCENNKNTAQTNEDEKNVYVNASLEMFKSPVEVEIAFGPLIQAMKEGRPVIVDEMNAIPHHVLILMNDLLTRKAGETIIPLIPGAEPFKIQEGFCVLATGNYKPEDGLMYVGRQPLDAAFLSRFKLMDYDYLPNSRSFEPVGLDVEGQRKWRAENELLQMMAIKLLNKDLTANLPSEVFGQLERLSVVSRVLQDVFSGKEVDPAWGAERNGNKVPANDVLKENVLSIRHLIPIVDKWKNGGFTNTLDKYLFDEYVSRSNARPEEKVYLYRMLKIMGGFFDGKGWPDADKKNDILNFSTEKVDTSENPKFKFYNQAEIIESVFGARPKRELIGSSVFSKEQNGKKESSVDSAQAVETLRMSYDLYRSLGNDSSSIEKFLSASKMTVGELSTQLNMSVEVLKDIWKSFNNPSK